MAVGKGYILALLTVLFTTFALKSIGQSISGKETHYQKFLRQHYDYPKSSVGNRYCNTMMQRRSLTRPKCKAVNSFIHGSRNDIVNVCANGGKTYIHGRNLRVSLSPLQTTTCRYKGGSTHPPCDYRERQTPRYIVVRCRNGEPVHFDESLTVTTKP